MVWPRRGQPAASSHCRDAVWSTVPQLRLCSGRSSGRLVNRYGAMRWAAVFALRSDWPIELRHHRRLRKTNSLRLAVMLCDVSIGTRGTAMQNDKLLSRASAIAYLANNWGYSRSAITLSKMASAGTGPQFRKLGRFTYYSQDDLDEFMRAHLGPRQQSTKSPRPAA